MAQVSNDDYAVVRWRVRCTCSCRKIVCVDNVSSQTYLCSELPTKADLSPEGSSLCSDDCWLKMSLRTQFPEKELVLEVSANKKARFYVRKSQQFLRCFFGDDSDPSDWRGKEFVRAEELADCNPLESKPPRAVVLVGRGAALQKTVAIAETIKREVPKVAQNTQICWFSSKVMGANLDERESGSNGQLIPSIRITLWRSEQNGHGSRESEKATTFQEPVHEQLRLDMVRFAEGQL